MYVRFCSGIFLMLVVIPAVLGQSQFDSPLQLPVGNGFGQIGIVAEPNEECRGPATVTPAPGGRLAILDSVNQKVLVAGGDATEEIKLPVDLLDPVDLIATTAGYLVVGALGEVVLVTPSGEIRTRLSTPYNPESGTPRLVVLPGSKLALENLSGTHTPIDISQTVMGEISDPGLVAAASFELKEKRPTKAVIISDSPSTHIKQITISSAMRIGDVRTVWASMDDGALIATQEATKEPEEASFVRLITVNEKGEASSETYLGPDAYGCNIRRPFARLTNGAVVSLSFGSDSHVAIKKISFSSVGSASPQAILKSPDVGLISSEQDIFKEIEKLNGTTSIGLIALQRISRESILDRARKALGMKWFMQAKNYSHIGVNSKCSPPNSVWRRPSRLDSSLEKEVTAIPYRWGGYAKSLDVFKKHLDDGKLAGSDCTCRNANCVYSNATGLDCSGFVSYAWQTGAYYTTRSLPDSKVSKPVLWANIEPGDIVNKAGSHVRLIESTSSSLNGRYHTLIESAANPSCGGVCRRSYPEAELIRQGYKPFKRLNLTN